MLDEGTQPLDARALLSPRELEVLEVTALGLTNGQIATRLNVSTHAVKFHLASIYRKLGVSNRTEAAVIFDRGRNVEASGRQTAMGL